MPQKPDTMAKVSQIKHITASVQKSINLQFQSKIKTTFTRLTAQIDKYIFYNVLADLYILTIVCVASDYIYTWEEFLCITAMEITRHLPVPRSRRV